MDQHRSKLDEDRRILSDAQQAGFGPTMAAYLRLSGPGWLQSAITLGGGSLAGALFIGALGGVSMLWLQLMAITFGVIMLSAISYVTLSTGKRPFDAINQHINPALGWSWLLASSLANMIWCMPQFALCYSALENMFPSLPSDSVSTQIFVSLVLLAIISYVVALNARRGVAARVFDLLLKVLVGCIVICFFGVVVLLAWNGNLEWTELFRGLFPDLRQWTQPSGKIAEILATAPLETKEFWTSKIVPQQRSQMIAAAATAVGINMTFLMPYAMLNRGWDRTFRGLARFDLMTGMAIPYVVVTGCVVIAAANAFHATADEAFLDSDPEVMMSSPTFSGAIDLLAERVDPDLAGQRFQNLSKDQQAAVAAQVAALSADEKKIASSMIRRRAEALSQTLAPLIGDRMANVIFGLGVFGMGFSTIIILMLINGFVFREAIGNPDSRSAYVAGCTVAGFCGVMWPLAWSGDSQFWFTIVASTFGMMLLPIAYFTFFMMMNSRTLMGDERPTGGRRVVWNTLMILAVLGALAAAGTSIYDRVADTSNDRAILAGRIVVTLLIVFILAVIAGFIMKRPSPIAKKVVEGNEQR